MKKRSIVLFVPVFAVFLAGPVFAEQFQITSYYPAPYGSYRDLETKKSLAVGDISVIGMTVGALSQGEVWVEDSVIFQGRDSDPPIPKEGEVIYNSAENTLKYSSDGATWTRVRSQCYVSYTGSCLAGYSNVGSAGDWRYCRRQIGINNYYAFCPPGVTVCPDPAYSLQPVSGSAIICCQ